MRNEDQKLRLPICIRWEMLCQVKWGCKIFEYEYTKEIICRVKWAQKQYGKIRRCPKLIDYGASKLGVGPPPGFAPETDTSILIRNSLCKKTQTPFSISPNILHNLIPFLFLLMSISRYVFGCEKNLLSFQVFGRQ